jgi:hypothetical protein
MRRRSSVTLATCRASSHLSALAVHETRPGECDIASVSAQGWSEVLNRRRLRTRRGRRQDGQAGRAHACAAARRGLSARGVDAGRADASLASMDLWPAQLVRQRTRVKTGRCSRPVLRGSTSGDELLAKIEPSVSRFRDLPLPVWLTAARAHQVDDVEATRVKELGDQSAMAARPKRFRAHEARCR